jgi:hypothetical protein
MTNKDEDYEHYRIEYLKSLKTAMFPWTPAYYYYMQNIDRIDVMGFKEFQQQIHALAQQKGEEVSKTIYQFLDNYFEVNELIGKDNKTLAVY